MSEDVHCLLGVLWCHAMPKPVIRVEFIFVCGPASWFT